MFITKSYLKPGMILAKDIYLNGRNFKTVLLTKGQPLNNHYIEKIIFHNIEGVYIENAAFNDLDYEYGINKNLETKALTEIKEVYSKLCETDGIITDSSIHKFSFIVDELISEILVKRELTNNVMDFKNHDEYTYQHCLSVANLSISTGISMGLSKQILHDLGMAGFLHDIGKTLIPLEILNKPGKLTSDEFEIIKSHPTSAVNMLKNLVSDDILKGIESHHEKLDGSGYPYGKSKENIPLYGRILAICDVYHALSSDRSYRKTCFPNEVIEYIMGCADTHFDYDILSVFLKSVVAFPIGIFVKLSNGKIGVVIKNHVENNIRPVVRIVNQDNTVGEDIDLLNDSHYMNTTIIDMGYDSNNIDFNNISKI
ncbi:MAG: HD-GYP domain-containing protein [Sedimentibacter sp.]|uniref:HD-GYP domain-containing protein n=1 Tax=Sedimentibacter sp. TaxID=1960295 RepID=UPI002982A6E7|nr:HD-GYP domain-containing protein [Sedimentibacter sp.]MDW5299405.1 HD-GYP domain-containing protein [Sedimentibacter sp.]